MRSSSRRKYDDRSIGTRSTASETRGSEYSRYYPDRPMMGGYRDRSPSGRYLMPPPPRSPEIFQDEELMLVAEREARMKRFENRIKDKRLNHLEGAHKKTSARLKHAERKARSIEKEAVQEIKQTHKEKKALSKSMRKLARDKKIMAEKIAEMEEERSQYGLMPPPQPQLQQFPGYDGADGVPNELDFQAMNEFELDKIGMAQHMQHQHQHHLEHQQGMDQLQQEFVGMDHLQQDLVYGMDQIHSVSPYGTPQGSIHAFDQSGRSDPDISGYGYEMEQQVGQGEIGEDNVMMGAEARKSYQSLVEIGRQHLGCSAGTVGGGSNTTPPPVQMIDPSFEDDDVSSFDGSLFGAGASRANRSYSRSGNMKNRNESGIDPGGQRSTSRSGGKLPRNRRGSGSSRIDHAGGVSREDDGRNRHSSSRNRDRPDSERHSNRSRDGTESSSRGDRNNNGSRNRASASSRSIGGRRGSGSTINHGSSRKRQP